MNVVLCTRPAVPGGLWQCGQRMSNSKSELLKVKRTTTVHYGSRFMPHTLLRTAKALYLE